MIKEFKDDYKWLSNFASVEITLDTFTYPSVEHAYQSAKCSFLWWKDLCSDTSNSASYVKRKSKTIKLVDDWDNIKIDIMKKCLEQKYNSDPYKTLLMNTNNQYIQEGNYWGDTFWGVCLKTNTGQNILGHLIMDIRDILLTNCR